MLSVRIIGYTNDVGELQAALHRMAEHLEEDCDRQHHGTPPVGQLYAGDEETCHLFLDPFQRLGENA